MNFVAGLRQEAEMFESDGKMETAARLEELAYYIESLEFTIKQIQTAVMTSVNPVPSEKVLKPIEIQKKRMHEWQYGTWSPGPGGKREMAGILDLKDNNG